MLNEEEQQQEKDSKSEKKRQAKKLQSLGIELADMSLAKLEKLGLPDELYQAILIVKTIKSHGAKRRQQQLIGKLMRGADYDSIIENHQHSLAEEKNQVVIFHEVELWRDRLLKENKASLTEFIATYKIEDIQQLKILIKKSLSESKAGQNKGAYTALFRFLKANML